MDVAAQDGHFVAKNEELDVFRATVTGELGRHLQNLTKEHVHQAGTHGLGRRRSPITSMGCPDWRSSAAF